MNHIRLFLSAAFLLAFCNSSFSQSAFVEGDNAINLGIGFGNHYYTGLGSDFSSTPALTVTYDHGLKDIEDIKGTIGLGGILGFQGSSYKWNDGLGDYYNEHWSNIIIAPRVTYHAGFLNTNMWDLYAAFFLGIRIESYNFETNNSSYNALYEGNYGGTNLAAGLTIGGAYYFTPVIGVFAELGYDVAYFKVGISIKPGSK